MTEKDESSGGRMERESGPEPVYLLRGPWDSNLSELLRLARNRLLVASPFITRWGAEWISKCLSERGDTAPEILLITNIRAESVLTGYLELGAVANLGRRFGRFSLFHMPSLHAKVYIPDTHQAIITSGNLTDGGLRGNCEYGVLIKEAKVVGQIRKDFEGYCRLAASISVDEATALAGELSEVRKVYEAGERRVLREAGKTFRDRLRAAEERVLRFRARGTSNQAIFCNTIEYLLSKGPLRTIELHPLVQQMHPDICDDTVDRVIDGVSFGKKWKHHVRTAQQALKREGRISFDGERWHLLA